MRRLGRITGAALLLSAGGGAVADPLPPEEAGRFAAPGITYRGGASLHFTGIAFGGLSALAVVNDGARALALSDAGHWFELALSYDPAGALADAKLVRHGPVVDAAGKRPATKRAADTEALAPLPDGGFAVAYEQQHRIMRFAASDPPFSRAPVALAAPEGLSRAPTNGGIEALTVLSDGKFFALAEDLPASAALIGERPGSWGRGWIGDGKGWGSFAYARQPGFAPSDATLLPDGDLLVLERAWLSLAGFAFRLVRVSPTEIVPGRAVTGREVARVSLPLLGDNFEGLAARRTKDGRTLLYLVSDNNFSLFLRTALIMLELN